MGEIIVTISGKGGTGKTTTVANLGVALAKLGKETLVVDMDLGLRNLDLALGLQDEVTYDVLDVISGACNTREAVIQCTKCSGLYFLAASQFKEKSVVTAEDMSLLADMLRDKYDYILMDCPAGLGGNVEAVLSVADTVLLVVNHDPFSMRDGDMAAALALKNNKASLKMIVNRYKTDLVRSGKMPSILQVIESMAVSLIGAIPDNDAILLSGISGTPVALQEKEAVARCYLEAAARLTGKKIPILDVNLTKKQMREWRKANKSKK